MVVSTKQLVLIILSVSCVLCFSEESSLTVKDPKEGLFLTIDWYGAQTKPVPTAAFGCDGQTNALNQWLAKNAAYGKVGILSSIECQKLNRLICGGDLPVRPSTNQPNIKIQQYVVTRHTSSNHLYFAIGWVDDSTVQFLEDLKGTLEPRSMAVLKPIIINIKRIKANSRKHEMLPADF